ncbi:MAG: carboxypeptidase-like regulatory domain-containing protein [candidate division Zixibacteria bacterium]
MKLHRAILGLIVFILGITISCDNTGVEKESMDLAGRVTEADTSVYLEGVIVIDNLKNTADTTDENGYFTLRDISFEKHMVSFEKEGYVKFEMEVDYPGSLSHPLVSKHVILEKAGE